MCAYIYTYACIWTYTYIHMFMVGYDSLTKSFKVTDQKGIGRQLSTKPAILWINSERLCRQIPVSPCRSGLCALGLVTQLI